MTHYTWARKHHAIRGLDHLSLNNRGKLAGTLLAAVHLERWRPRERVLILEEATRANDHTKISARHSV